MIIRLALLRCPGPGIDGFPAGLGVVCLPLSPPHTLNTLVSASRRILVSGSCFLFMFVLSYSLFSFLAVFHSLVDTLFIFFYHVLFQFSSLSIFLSSYILFCSSSSCHSFGIAFFLLFFLLSPVPFLFFHLIFFPVWGHVSLPLFTSFQPSLLSSCTCFFPTFCSSSTCPVNCFAAVFLLSTPVT